VKVGQAKRGRPKKEL